MFVTVYLRENLCQNWGNCEYIKVYIDMKFGKFGENSDNIFYIYTV
jgi:hypothetical protein